LKKEREGRKEGATEGEKAEPLLMDGRDWGGGQWACLAFCEVVKGLGEKLKKKKTEERENEGRGMYVCLSVGE